MIHIQIDFVDFYEKRRSFSTRIYTIFDSVFQNELDNATASMVKLICTEKLNQHSSNLLQLFGGWGYMWEYEIARIFAGARVMSIYGGTSEIMKELISRSIY